MPGIVKRKFISENNRIAKSMTRPFTLISEILPLAYDGKILLDYYKQLYPHEWNVLVERCANYKDKDAFLVKQGKKTRYGLTTAENFFFSLPKVKYILSKGQKDMHATSNDAHTIEIKKRNFFAKRKSAILKMQNKISNNKKNMQFIDPLFLDLYDYAYHKKGITQIEKLEIVNELFKYDTPRVVYILHKINDAERNDQIRNLVFHHLQTNGHYVKLRKKFKGKIKPYQVEEYDYDMTPQDLVEHLDGKRLQNMKQFDMFISHSAKDAELVREVIKNLNKKNITCYCDWISDTDFLKRNLVSEYTKIALKRRIEQSKVFLFIKTNNSITDDIISSPWIQLEYDYAKTISKKIYIMDLTKKKND